MKIVSFFKYFLLFYFQKNFLKNKNPENFRDFCKFLKFNFNPHRTMVGPHLVVQIPNRFCWFPSLFFTPNRINPPPDICLTRASFYIPPRIHFRHTRIFATPNIRPIFALVSVEPRTLSGVKTNFSIILLRSCQIDFIMCNIDIARPNHDMTLITKRIDRVEKIFEKFQFSRPSLFRLSTIWKINSKNVKDFSLFFQRQMHHTTLIGVRIARKICFYFLDKRHEFVFYPNRRARISIFFRRIVKSFIAPWLVQVSRKLIRATLNFL